MAIKIGREDTKDFKVAVVEPVYQEEPTVYDLKYLVYRLDIQKHFQLSDTETKIISFVISFDDISPRFYFGNEKLSKMFDKSTTTISLAISTLEEKGLISCNRQIMAGGGEIRFIRLSENLKQGFQKTVSKAFRKLKENSNKINTNKKNISNDRVKPIYGNKDLIALKEVIIKNYPKPLDGITDTRKLQNLKQVCSKRKNQDEWMDDNWKENFKKFFSLYLDITKEEYLVNSLDKLREKAKLWREYRGKLS